MKRLLFLLPALLSAGCSRAYVANSSARVAARPNALACVRERAADLGYATQAAGRDTLVVRGERPRVGDRLRVALDPAANTLSIAVESAASPTQDRAAGARILSDVQLIGQTCGVLTVPADSAAQPRAQ